MICCIYFLKKRHDKTVLVLSTPRAIYDRGELAGVRWGAEAPRRGAEMG